MFLVKMYCELKTTLFDKEKLDNSRNQIILSYHDIFPLDREIRSKKIDEINFEYLFKFLYQFLMFLNTIKRFCLNKIISINFKIINCLKKINSKKN
ncbi:hypothetical protein BpHYR1_053638 [Brachionus plicatilis]|uniref:Uncharacterized protein n=1 Tax=Brachionus plicatilis TaxID=10195 RepID=A0A3M7QQM0_BRAPC|nr:hypothetical protein BpHYR1_053638 [Brachionus plicatilis]